MRVWNAYQLIIFISFSIKMVEPFMPLNDPEYVYEKIGCIVVIAIILCT